MPLRDPPEYAAWQHRDARDGLEVVFLHGDDRGYRLEGETAALEDGEPWAVRYVITLDPGWLTRSAWVSGHSASGAGELNLEADGAGGWRINGSPAPTIHGCLDVDLESSALTNALPVHRLGLGIGQEADVSAAYVRARDLSLERLEQRYLLLDDDGSRERYHYTAPQFDFECELSYDKFGLVLDYPGIAIRAA